MHDASRSSPHRLTAPALLAIVTIGCMAPFVNKAYHLDDTLFLLAAQQILEHPLDFYGFEVNWYGVPMPMVRATNNPPGGSYFIAAVAAVAGFGEMAMHIAFLLPAIAAVLGVHHLARRFSDHPVAAALVAAFTPAFLVSSTSVMPDTILLALWTWAVVWWVRGLDEKRSQWLILSAVLIAAAALCRYFGICAALLLSAYTIARRSRASVELLWLIVPVAALAAYTAWTNHLYDYKSFLETASYAKRSRFQEDESPLMGMLVALAFTGGAMLPVLFFSARLWSIRRIIIGIELAAIGAIALVLLDPSFVPALDADGINLSLAGHTGVFAATGVAVIALTLFDLHQRRDADALLLALWVLGTFAFIGFINWMVNVRAALPMAPAVAILIMRRVDRVTAMPLVLSAIVALTVAAADQSRAHAARSAAEHFAGWPSPHRTRVQYQGHWGFVYYMDQFGFRHARFDRPAPPGTLMIVPIQNTNVQLPDRRFVARAAGHVEPMFPYVSLHDMRYGAGFHGHRFGPAPFVFCRTEPAEYVIYQLGEPRGR